MFGNAVVTGIVAGLVTAGLLWLGRAVWKDQVEPWWENLVYKDTRLDGSNWHAVLETDVVEKYEEDVSLKQVGHKVYGTMTCVEGPESDKGHSYKFNGSFRNSILSATYFATDRSALDCGSFSLQLKDNGNKLEGHVSYYFDPDHLIMSRPYVWTRVSGTSGH